MLDDAPGLFSDKPDFPFHEFVDGAPIGVCVYRRGRIIYANEAVATILGLDAASDILQSSVLDWLPSAGCDSVFRKLRAMLRSHALTGKLHTQLRRMDGSLVDVGIHGMRLSRAGAPALHMCFVEESDRNAAEASLLGSLPSFQSLVEWSPFGLCVVQRGTIAYANPAASRMFGAAAPAELVGTSLFARVHPKNRTSAVERINVITRSGADAPLRDLQFLKVNGRPFDVECHASAIQYQSQQSIQLSFSDVSARSLTERALRESEERFRVLVDLSSDWYWEQDEHFRFTTVSEKVLECSGGHSPKAHIGKTRWELPALNITAQQWEEHKKQLLQHRSFRDFEICRVDEQGRVGWASVSGAPKYDTLGQFCGYRGVGRNITAQKLDAEKIHQLAYFDTLTQLPNRRMLIDRLGRTLQSTVRHGVHGALLFIDLDNFKTLNDTLGHDIGDILLQQVAARLTANVRSCDTVARLGGDEFVVVIEDLDVSGMNAATQADAIAQKILLALNVPYQLAGRDHVSSPSVGITLFGMEQQSVDDLLRQADLAMYQSKAAGRNSISFFDRRMQEDVDQRVALESDLRDGLQDGEELELYFQPIVAPDGWVSGAEALVRWLQPVRGLVLPDQFIPLAEATGLIVPLGRWVLKTACERLAQWSREEHTRHLVLSVNISVRELRDPHFVSHVRNALYRSGAPAQRLRMELTETVLVDRIDETILQLAQLRALGIGLSLDDFGTGYSSLVYLKKLPLDLMKIDRSFVQDVLADPSDAAIARAMVALGKNLGLIVVAEGVELMEQRRFFSELGCSGFQGNLFAPPMPAADFDQWIRVRGGRCTPEC